MYHQQRKRVRKSISFWACESEMEREKGIFCNVLKCSFYVRNVFWKINPVTIYKYKTENTVTPWAEYFSHTKGVLVREKEKNGWKKIILFFRCSKGNHERFLVLSVGGFSVVGIFTFLLVKLFLVIKKKLKGRKEKFEMTLG